MDEKQTSKWIVAATCSSLVLLFAVGGAFAFRDKVFADVRAGDAKQTSEREKLASRMTALESKLDDVAASAKPDNAPIEALNAKIDELTKRLDGIEKIATEKKPEPAPVMAAPPAPAVEAAPALPTLILSGKPFATELAVWQKAHPNAGDSIAALAPYAERGLPTEAQLVDKLRDTLDAIPTHKEVDAGPIAEKINSHLEGLVKIRKTSDADPYVALRKHAMNESYPSLLREVEQLSEAQRAPFTAWLDAAHNRAAAVSAIANLAGHAV